jgi:hypothetical protein
MKAEFARWMRSQLGYQSCTLDFPITDTEAGRTRFASVRGERYANAYYYLCRTAIFLLCASLVSRVLIPVRAGDAPVVATSLAYLSLATYLVSLIGRVRTRRYSWVVCKDPARPLSHEELVGLKDDFERVRRSTKTTWMPVKLLVVAGARGFDEAAVAVAQAFHIECFQREERGFRHVR